MAGQTELEASFSALEARLSPEVARHVGAPVEVRVGAAPGTSRWLDFSRTEAPFVAVRPAGAGPARCVWVVPEAADWLALVAGSLTPTLALTSGRLRIEGDLTVAMRLERSVFY